MQSQNCVVGDIQRALGCKGVHHWWGIIIGLFHFDTGRYDCFVFRIRALRVHLFIDRLVMMMVLRVFGPNESRELLAEPKPKITLPSFGFECFLQAVRLRSCRTSWAVIYLDEQKS